VYAREVKGRTVTLFVSGKLWKRSLVMQDKETGTLWSHILGKGIEGTLRGVELPAIPSEITTWAAWRDAHPDTTVLALSRTTRRLDHRYHMRRPEAFVYGWMVGGAFCHVPVAALAKHPLLQTVSGGLPLLVVYNPESTSVRLFLRRVEDRALEFEPLDDGRMRDTQTGSVWERMSGRAVAGPLKGERLPPQVGLLSFARAWESFHPDSEEVR
jgi:hypothetical protein